MRPLLALAAIASIASTPATAFANLKEAFTGASYKGSLRIHSDFTNKVGGGSDEYGNAFGGYLGLETDATQLWGLSLGATYMTTNDLGTSRSLAAERSDETPTDDIDTLGEAFVRLRTLSTTATAGRQQVNIPFANVKDEEILPMSFAGYSLVNKSLRGVTFSAYHLTRVRDFASTSFQNTGQFTLTKNGSTAQDTGGTTVIGLEVEGPRGSWSTLIFREAEIWYHIFPDLMDMVYLEGSKEIPLSGGINLFYGLQTATQSATGDKLGGDFKSTMVGAELGVEIGRTTISAGYNKAQDGKFLAPFTEDNDPFFTTTPGNLSIANIDSGDGYKVAIEQEIGDSFELELSWASYSFDSGTDLKEGAFEFEYEFSDSLEGLELGFSLANQFGDVLPTGVENAIEYRTYLHYGFN